ncbi:MAG: Chaperone, Hsp100 family, ClpC-type [candidate division WWE3 bacterium GW2011_GWD2_42_11]|uniref:Sigma-54 factor interaction domain-containing protein n=3 Tax=Katanobacteria TaxID=422282 RepID=A0A1F4VZI7_UNCKA|nr:MAG: Chaperone, Hsp100 family, ClpC-type [candidate division WWE3 bacterium GW2011_GWC2_41_23]KKS26933.1 MAG: hypothetical protein UU86_C0028G0008 [candidate division WWE3 bacterium GW2011_GWC1_42_102]KKS28681.1 MAG: Chaperone, Hsp100 family, ClpC-type [candidate division WWE3 bacterium GW2011_GWD2_42_11]KKS40969.1 MAG: Chaperone, Hsp100 family, ClpC-type [candidate division WWE3 bacterium GW2011_GWE1_42_16]KKS51295.1 MAG: Chaperone, Hsp100 family, ClpC-type [candidate division WWE3 bacteriu
MKSLPRLPHEFLIWWLLKAPRRILKISSRLIALTNNQISFTTNFRLLFVPLFGDYTLVGRFIGFTIRIVWIVFGFVFFLLLLPVCALFPVAWYLTPAFVFKYGGPQYALAYVVALYLLYLLRNRDTPRIRVRENTKENFQASSRKNVLVALEKLDSEQSSGMKWLFDLDSSEIIFKRSEINKDLLFEKLRSAPSIQISALGQAAFADALRFKSKYIETDYLLLALLNNVPKIDIILSSLNTSIKNVAGSIEWESDKRNEKDKIFIWQDDYELLFTGGFGKGMLGRVTPTLDAVSRDYTREIALGRYKRILGRETDIKNIAQILSGSKENVLIVGEPGSGKTTLVKGIAQRIMESNEYKAVSNHRLVSLDIGGLISGTTSPGKIAENLNNIMGEVKSSGDIILFIDEIHNLVAGAGDADAETSKIYTMLEPHLANDKIKFIGATTVSNYRKYIEPNGAFARLFHLVQIDELPKDVTVKILEAKADKLESKENIFVTYPALVKTVDLSEKLMHERVLPDKAVDILNRTSTRVLGGSRLLSSSEVATEIAEITKIPVETVTQDEAQKLLSIEDTMKKMVIGQDEAVRQISTALRRARAGIRDENKPIASFLFVGTTGIGKTQTAKALAKHYFGHDTNMIRLDMSEYQQIDSMNRLLGDTAGNKGLLTEMVRTKPFALILLDEVEKAHPNILLTFLQVLDEGKLTDNSGMEIDFTNTIIIATSNVGTKSIQQVFSEHGTLEKMRERALADVREKFAPEFLNRFSGIIVFNPLTEQNVREITLLMLDKVRELSEEKGINVRFKQDLIDVLSKKGYSPEWGARPLARVIEDTVETYIATKMLKKEINAGDQVLLGTEAMD